MTHSQKLDKAIDLLGKAVAKKGGRKYGVNLPKFVVSGLIGDASVGITDMMAQKFSEAKSRFQSIVKALELQGW